MQAVLSRKGDYSVRAMLHLAAGEPGGRQKAQRVAAAMEIPHRYAPQILAGLVAAGMLRATAGPDGGYELARPPDDITLLEVVEAVEGPILLERCVLRGGPCEWSEACPIHETWSRAQRAFIAELATTTFGDLAAIAAALAAGTYTRPDDAPGHRLPTSRGGRRL